MRITFVIPFAGLHGGIRVAAIYATRLAARGHEVRVVSQPARRRRWTRRVKDALRGRPAPPAPAASTLFEPLGEAHRVLERPRPVTFDDVGPADVVVATWWETAEWVAALPPEAGRPVYLLQDYECFPDQPRDRVAATYHLGFRMLAVSGYIRDVIAREHGVEGIELLPNGVDMAQFDAPDRGRNARFTLGVMHQREPRKNLPLALEVLARARREIPELEIVSFGRDQPRDALALPPGARFEQRPPQDCIPALYAACDAWLFTSRNEGFGLPILEAMACGTPVLATRAGAAPDILRDGANGFLLEDDPAAFLDRVHRMRDMPEAEWRAMSRAARETARARDWDRAVTRFETLLAQ